MLATLTGARRKPWPCRKRRPDCARVGAIGRVRQPRTGCGCDSEHAVRVGDGRRRVEHPINPGAAPGQKALQIVDLGLPATAEATGILGPAGGVAGGGGGSNLGRVTVEEGGDVGGREFPLAEFLPAIDPSLHKLGIAHEDAPPTVGPGFGGPIAAGPDLGVQGARVAAAQARS